MTRMVISEYTLSPTFIDDEPDRGEYADCDWEPACMTHGDCCEMDTPDCVVPPTEHPRCHGLLR